MKLTRYQR